MRSVWYSTQSWRNEISKGFKLDFNVTFMDTTDHFFFVRRRIFFAGFLHFFNQIYQLTEIFNAIHQHSVLSRKNVPNESYKKYPFISIRKEW